MKNMHIHPVMRDALNAHLDDDDDDQPDAGWWRCRVCKEWSPPTWAYCTNSHYHPDALSGGPE